MVIREGLFKITANFEIRIATDHSAKELTELMGDASSWVGNNNQMTVINPTGLQSMDEVLRHTDLIVLPSLSNTFESGSFDLLMYIQYIYIVRIWVLFQVWGSGVKML